MEILIPDSEEEDEDVNASEEERAFLMAIDQEERLQKTAEMETNSSTENNNWYKSVGQNDIVKNSISGNNVNSKNIECFASTAELLKPKN